MLDSGNSLIPTDWSRDGRTILFSSSVSAAGFRLWRWGVAGIEKPDVVVDTTQNAMHARLSPGGQ
jgi:hypothetical protein